MARPETSASSVPRLQDGQGRQVCRQGLMRQDPGYVGFALACHPRSGAIGVMCGDYCPGIVIESSSSARNLRWFANSSYGTSCEMISTDSPSTMCWHEMKCVIS
jgi:hypothetical protein